MNITLKIFTVVLAAVILTAASIIISLNIKLSMANTKNIALTADISHIQAQLTLADAAIAKQNDTLDRLRLEAEANTATITNEYARLDKKYQLLAKKSATKLGNSPTCEDQLKAIYESQEAFCYER